MAMALYGRAIAIIFVCLPVHARAVPKFIQRPYARRPCTGAGCSADRARLHSAQPEMPSPQNPSSERELLARSSPAGLCTRVGTAFPAEVGLPARELVLFDVVCGLDGRLKSLLVSVALQAVDDPKKVHLACHLSCGLAGQM